MLRCPGCSGTGSPAARNAPAVTRAGSRRPGSCQGTTIAPRSARGTMYSAAASVRIADLPVRTAPHACYVPPASFFSRARRCPRHPLPLHGSIIRNYVRLPDRRCTCDPLAAAAPGRGPDGRPGPHGDLCGGLEHFEVGEDFVCGADSFGRAAFHEALEVGGAVFPGEVDVALALAFVAAEAGVLAGLPVGVGTEEVRVGEGGGEHRLAVPLGGDAGEDRLELGQELLGEHGDVGVCRGGAV